MEGLVNYSSEDDQDEQVYKSGAERGGGSGNSSTHLKLTSPNYDNDAKRRRDDDSSYSSKSHHVSAGTNSGERAYKEEEKFIAPSAGYGGNRSSSRSQSNRDSSREQRDSKDDLRDGRIDSRNDKGDFRGGRSDSRDRRDQRDNRDSRDNRDYKNSYTKDNRDYNNKGDYKNDRHNRSKEYNNRDQRRENNFHDNRRSRNDDRNDRGGNGNNRSHHKDHRYNNNNGNNNNRYSDSSNPRRYQNFREDRADNRGERYGSSRKQHSPTSHSPSPPSSSAHSKRSHNDVHRNRNRGRNSRSRSRSYSSPSHKRSPSPYRPSSRPMDQARSTASDLEKKLNTSEFKLERDLSRQSSHRNTEAVVTLPLSETATKPPTVIAVTPASNFGNSEPAVIQLPSYYNPSVINPNKYAEQVQKRKLIWGAKKKEDTAAKWGHAQFSQDSDGKVASKFMRLMGIKGGAPAAKSDAVESDKQPDVDVTSREKMFTSMEKQYEVARQVTHTMRGVGLGFSSQTRPF